ncbi:MAG TPA: hypothetical protein VGM22_18270 [Methylomirabilota bacterium]
MKRAAAALLIAAAVLAVLLAVADLSDARHRPRRWLSRALKASIGRVLSVAAAGDTSAPIPAGPDGGFFEPAVSTAVRPRLSVAQIEALLPARGPFTFPSPYGTRGVRITNGSDCGGRDCVQYVGYSYWRRTNNHVGRDTMLILIVLGRNAGGAGPTLFSYDKRTDAVTRLTPLFDAGDPMSWAAGDQWYFSATDPHMLYVNDGSMLRRYDVARRRWSTVFDVSTRPDLFGRDRLAWQTHSSQDDTVHSATIKDRTTSAEVGCLAYQETTRRFAYFPSKGIGYDECQVDKSGRWLLIKEKVVPDPKTDVDNRIIDLETGQETVLMDRDGAGGHSDNGFGYMVAADNWNPEPGAFRLWKFGQTPLTGAVVYHNADWTTIAPNHVSHANARRDVPPEQQYVCGSGAARENTARGNEIFCFRLDGSMRVLVVAPVMTDMDAPGGGQPYAKLPKGNLDVTGRYFVWTSNMGGPRLDAFVVKVPAP